MGRYNYNKVQPYNWHNSYKPKYGYKGKYKPSYEHLCAIARKALKTAMFLRKNTDMLLKTVDNYVAPGTSMPFGPTCTMVSAIGPGDLDYQRQGSAVRFKSVYLTGTLQQASGAGTTASSMIIRLALVVDTQFQGSTALFSDVFKNVGPTGTAGSQTIDAPLNVFDYPGRFRVLFDQQFKLGGTSDQYNLQYMAIRDKDDNNRANGVFRYLDLKARFDGDSSSSSGTIARTNAIYLVSCIAGITGVVAPLWDYNVRLRFYDQ